MSGEIQEFLSRGRASEPVADTPAPDQPEQVETPAVETPRAAEAVPAETPPAEERPARDGVVPRQALDAERAERRDWKDKAIRAETERDNERRERENERRASQERIAALEAAQRQPAVPQPVVPPPQAVPLPNPLEDPEGYASAVRTQMQAEAKATYERVQWDSQQTALRAAQPAAAVDLAYQAVQAAAQTNPALANEIMSKPNPWAAIWDWAVQNNPYVKVLSEMGSDPEAWRAAQLEKGRAEGVQSPAPTPPAPPVPTTPSLAGARSAGPRDAGAYTGPKSLAQIIVR